MSQPLWIYYLILMLEVQVMPSSEDYDVYTTTRFSNLHHLNIQLLKLTFVADPRFNLYKQVREMVIRLGNIRGWGYVCDTIDINQSLHSAYIVSNYINTVLVPISSVHIISYILVRVNLQIKKFRANTVRRSYTVNTLRCTLSLELSCRTVKHSLKKYAQLPSYQSLR